MVATCWREPWGEADDYNYNEFCVFASRLKILRVIRRLMTSAPQPGIVYLVGAGPGDPGLITLRGIQCLARADAVLYDYLANPQLLACCRPDAEKVNLGKHGGPRLWSQEEINAALVSLAREGKTVVRLKSGDPVVFARGSEEIDALTAAGIAYEIVPGITAALAAGSYAGIPITHRELASAAALVTGHEDGGKEGPPLDYAALAAFPGTLVFYMGVTTAARWSAELIAAGKSRDCPVAVIRRVSLPDQKVWQTTLGDVARFVADTKLRPPVIFVVGPVASLGRALSWFEKRPLFGKSVLVTRPTVQLPALLQPLAELGAEVLVQPAIEIRPVDDFSTLDSAFARIGQFDWLVFSSTNGVEAVVRRIMETGRDLRILGDVKIAAIGPGTGATLRAHHLRADLVPGEFRAEALAEALAADARGQRFLLIRASRGREILAETLEAAGGSVEQVVAYQSIDVASPDPEIAARLKVGRIDWITVTSSAIARSLARMFGPDLRRARLASISPVTSGTLRELGYEPAAEATEYTMEGVAAAILRAVQGPTSPT